MDRYIFTSLETFHGLFVSDLIDCCQLLSTISGIFLTVINFSKQSILLTMDMLTMETNTDKAGMWIHIMVKSFEKGKADNSGGIKWLV